MLHVLGHTPAAWPPLLLPRLRRCCPLVLTLLCPCCCCLFMTHHTTQVETDAYERVYQRCQNERMAQHRAFTWGNREAARKMELASCSELGRLHERMGSHRPAGTVR